MALKVFILFKLKKSFDFIFNKLFIFEYSQKMKQK